MTFIIPQSARTLPLLYWYKLGPIYTDIEENYGMDSLIKCLFKTKTPFQYEIDLYFRNLGIAPAFSPKAISYYDTVIIKIKQSRSSNFIF